MATPSAHVIFLLDNSSSMSCRAGQTRQAFDGFIETLQKCKGAEIRVTLVKYGSTCVNEYFKRHIQDVKPLEYNPPDGQDMLFDALVYGIKIADEDKESGKKIIVMQCDGGDTGVSKSTPEQVRALITDRLAKGCEFTFLAAGGRAGLQGQYQRPGMSSGVRYGGEVWVPALIAKWVGIPEANIIQYSARADVGSYDYELNRTITKAEGDDSAIKAFAASAWNVGLFASGVKKSTGFTDEQRAGVKS